MVNRGLGPEDLPGVYREEFLHAVEWARHEYDPCRDWTAFREALWSALVPAFGLDVESVELEDPEAGGSAFPPE